MKCFNRFSFSHRLVSILLLSCLSSLAFGHWVLDAKQSSLHYASIKNESIAEINQFKGLSGEADDENGKVTVTIDLASVDTGISLRDQRMRTLFFVVNTFPKATLTTTIPAKTVASLNTGESKIIETDVSLALHGHSKAYKSKLRIVKQKEHEVLVVTEEPIVVFAEDFDLEEGVTQLQKLAGLTSITTSVPVTASLVFTQKHK